jgi:hypothetical protein
MTYEEIKAFAEQHVSEEVFIISQPAHSEDLPECTVGMLQELRYIPDTTTCASHIGVRIHSMMVDAVFYCYSNNDNNSIIEIVLSTTFSFSVGDPVLIRYTDSRHQLYRGRAFTLVGRVSEVMKDAIVVDSTYINMNSIISVTFYESVSPDNFLESILS